ncbi:MAG: hypothetical protein ACE5EP_02305 [Candidatus Methylomirabilales bacterium]
MWVKLVCSDPTVVFHGQRPGPKGPKEVLASARQKAMTLGLPVQLEIEGYGTKGEKGSAPRWRGAGG